MIAGPLRQALEAATREYRVPMSDLTVLDKQNDPYRVDTEARHRDGEWLATTARSLGLGDRRIHLRGLHYMLIGRPKPDGSPYTNTAKDWLWLSGDAGKAARWLKYIPFDQIVDQRNTPPTVREFKRIEPWPYISVGVEVDIPDAADINPTVGCADFTGVQPYRIVLVGEKSSLAEVLAPIATTHEADLFLPAGEMSDTMAYQMVKAAAADGRPMVVLYFADCDPAGWQMPISVCRKLQGLQTLMFPELEFSVYRVGLTPDQVRAYGLPSTPLKETELRGDRWQAAMGVEQTEIDALASLQPDLLRTVALDAIRPFWDHTLYRRVAEARWRWVEQAQAALDAVLDGDRLAQIRETAAVKLAELRTEIDAINAALRIDKRDVELPEPVVPEAHAPGGGALPLLDSAWPFAEQCRRLIDSKAYRTRGADA